MRPKAERLVPRSCDGETMADLADGVRIPRLASLYYCVDHDALDDAIRAVQCGVRYNLWMILKKLRLLYAFVAALLNLSIAANMMAQ
jgi:hypothetical protein